ncbi:cytochrome b [Herbaspirillum sp. alder98]|uniref:cytochrome b n=1 Tax=Herbaspirillum sp. alder98 TaxID=2913096 RepID=UPI001CD8DC34|nr:cytochrome b [Herbaspirillum sp. alder98]MCA1325245.1 cytochrome b [Herbaspirillum sp. alder98]
MDRYTKPAVLLHWLIAVLIIAAFGLGLTMVNIPGLTPTKLKYFSWHKWVGVTVLALACLRLLWRLTHQAPAYPAHMPTWQQAVAHWMHVALYALMFAIPVSGYVYSLSAGVPVVYLGIVPLPVFMAPNPELKPLLKDLHYVLNMTLLAAFCLHVLAALKHQFIDRDNLFRRILP